MNTSSNIVVFLIGNKKDLEAELFKKKSNT